MTDDPCFELSELTAASGDRDAFGPPNATLHAVFGANDVQEEAEARVGATLKGKWRLDRLIGVGGTAAVYEARHQNESRVAVKILHRRVALSAEQLARFRREGMAANRVGHRAIPVVHDDDVDEHGAPFLVMDLLHGQTIAERAATRGGSLPPEEVLDIAERLLDVLVAAHARNILHRDIKPQNLFLTDAGELKVLDFGIARLNDPAIGALGTEIGRLLGTPAFVPPEQARGRPDEMDARSDVWAVGATMYTLLTGRFVHEAPTPSEQLGLAQLATAPSLAVAGPSLPKQLVLVVDRALSYARDDRWPDARSMQEAVQWLREQWKNLGDASLEVPGAWVAPSRQSSSGAISVVTGSPTVTASAPRRRDRVLIPILLVTASVVAALVAREWTAARAKEPLAHSDAPSVSPSTPTRATPIPSPVPKPLDDSRETADLDTAPVPPLPRRVPLIHARSFPTAAPAPPSAAPAPLASEIAPVPPPAPARNPLDRRY